MSQKEGDGGCSKFYPFSRHLQAHVASFAFFRIWYKDFYCKRGIGITGHTGDGDLSGGVAVRKFNGSSTLGWN
jgi:hypothetical protein